MHQSICTATRVRVSSSRVLPVSKMQYSTSKPPSTVESASKSKRVNENFTCQATYLLPIYLPTYLLTYLSMIGPMIHPPPIHPSIRPSVRNRSIDRSIDHPVYLSVYLSIYPPTHPPTYPASYLSIHPPTCASIYLSIRLRIAGTSSCKKTAGSTHGILRPKSSEKKLPL